MKVLLPVDGSAHTQKALDYLFSHPGLLGAEPEFVVLNVQLPIPPRAARAVGREMVESYHHAEAEAVLDPVRKFLTERGARFTTRMVVGHAAEEILKLAEAEHVDLIVMGSRGHGPFRALVMGSVVQRVVAGAHVPVMVIH
ncbi:MAG: universal stress protein [Casimicrobiaceae bacterium]|nr:universal stress protein [Casimicrobiaceae bacterium]MCX8097670.1 universal stress protein [Casimicrobiaceae bacterium]MDW8312263.1 universal stress protein [Burkholderiales bacterium]